MIEIFSEDGKESYMTDKWYHPLRFLLKRFSLFNKYIDMSH